jgi:hypothetical protein
MKIYAFTIVLVVSIAASAAAAPGAGWYNPAGYGGQYVQQTQLSGQTVYAQPAAYRGLYGMNRGYGYAGYSGGGAGCDHCGNGHAGVCWDCSNAWAGYCNEARGCNCAGVWDGFCGERHCSWCAHHGGYRPLAHHRGHCGGHFGHAAADCGDACGGHCGKAFGGWSWKRPLFAKSCNACDTCEPANECDDTGRGCGHLGHCRPLAWLGAMCDKGLDNCQKGWNKCNACFAGLKGCFRFGRGCGGCDECDACGLGETSHIESAPITTEEVVPAQPSSDAPAPGPAA